MSTERIIVDESVADEFVAKLSAKAATLVAGDPAMPGSILASMVSAAAAEKVKLLVDNAVLHGAKLAAGGQIVGSIAQATVLDGVTDAMKIYSQESFGPVVSVMRVKGDDEAIRVANDTDYGLSAAIFSKDVSRALKLAARIRSGICHINSATVHDEAQMPFGGVGRADTAGLAARRRSRSSPICAGLRCRLRLDIIRFRRQRYVFLFVIP